MGDKPEAKDALSKINRLLDEALTRLDALEHQTEERLGAVEARLAAVEDDIGINDHEGRARLAASPRELREKTDRAFGRGRGTRGRVGGRAAGEDGRNPRLVRPQG